ncbi:MAG: c-type cytochrome [Chloroflexi bacterium]|nr:c-type cytochrome [Chloroflexota bacterium]MBI4216623.1 c-type cytochrome [Chloroflexota bacterium]
MRADPARRPRFNLPSPVGAFLILAGAFILLKLIQPVIPGSVILLYMAFVIAGILIHITLDDGRLKRFGDFFIGAEGEGAATRAQRWGLLLVVPLALGWWAYEATRPSYAPPVEIFQRHPTAGEEILGRIKVPEWVATPAKWSPQAIAEGKALYRGNCAVCHGDNLDGEGPAAEGFRYPIRPANFRDSGTIAQLTLPYVYWRLTVGGIQNQFSSAMPAWVAPADAANATTLHTYDLTPDEAWKVIIYLYKTTGFEPRKE